jgi:DNA-binding MarR family transcriptional regulator
MNPPSGSNEERTRRGESLTDVILLIFRSNGLLLAAGDALAAHEHLTSARWQVLGAVAMERRPLSVPQIARRMGLTRQSVHATVSHLAADGLVELTLNDDHKRSRLIRLTTAGEEAFAAIDGRQTAWSNELGAAFKLADLEATTKTLGDLCRQLDDSHKEYR